MAQQTPAVMPTLSAQARTAHLSGVVAEGTRRFEVRAKVVDVCCAWTLAVPRATAAGATLGQN